MRDSMRHPVFPGSRVAFAGRAHFLSEGGQEFSKKSISLGCKSKQTSSYTFPYIDILIHAGRVPKIMFEHLPLLNICMAQSTRAHGDSLAISRDACPHPHFGSSSNAGEGHVQSPLKPLHWRC